MKQAAGDFIDALLRVQVRVVYARVREAQARVGVFA